MPRCLSRPPATGRPTGRTSKNSRKASPTRAILATAYEGNDPLQSLDELALTNASWISLLVTGYQDTIHTTAIDYTGPGTPNDASLERIIAHAHGKGLKVMLKPHVDLADDSAHYRGEIGPDFTAADWAAWFASYRPFILHYAEMAERTACELFCVGCELGTTAVHAEEWRAIVAAVRGVYSGRLTYADNQVEYAPDAITWWDAVDFIGQDAYPTLTPIVEPTVGDLMAGWVPFRAKLQALAERWDKPLILTEIGCRSVAGGAQNPWDWQRQGAVDLDVQANFYEAALSSVAGLDWLRGDLLVAVVARPGRRRRGRHGLYAARQAGGGDPPLPVFAVRLSPTTVSTSPSGSPKAPFRER